MKTPHRGLAALLAAASLLTLAGLSLGEPDSSDQLEAAQLQVRGQRLDLYLPRIYGALAAGGIASYKDCPGVEIFLDAYSRRKTDPLYWTALRNDNSNFFAAAAYCYDLGNAEAATRNQRRYYLALLNSPAGPRRSYELAVFHRAKNLEITSHFDHLIASLRVGRNKEGDFLVHVDNDGLPRLRNLYRNMSWASFERLAEHARRLAQRRAAAAAVSRIRTESARWTARNAPSPVVVVNRPPTAALPPAAPAPAPMRAPEKPEPAKPAPVAYLPPPAPSGPLSSKALEAMRFLKLLRSAEVRALPLPAKTGLILEEMRRRRKEGLDATPEMERIIVAAYLREIGYAPKDCERFAPNLLARLPARVGAARPGHGAAPAASRIEIARMRASRNH